MNTICKKCGSKKLRIMGIDPIKDSREEYPAFDFGKLCVICENGHQDEATGFIVGGEPHNAPVLVATPQMKCEIIRGKELAHAIEYHLEFRKMVPGQEKNGWRFACDENGNPDWDIYNSTAYRTVRINLNACLCGTNNAKFIGISSFEYDYPMPAILQCHCGRQIELINELDNFCGCGACYDLTGQRIVLTQT